MAAKIFLLQDSISMVLKCFLKGAADYLIKPVRKNVLKNLWRHVWKRLSNNAGNNPRILTATQLKTKAPVEDNPANNHPNDNASSKWKCIAKPTKAQALQLLLWLMGCVAVGIVYVAECSSFTTASAILICCLM